MTIALMLALLAVYVQSPAKSSELTEPTFQQVIGVPSLTPLEIRNPEIALKYGVVGYLEITVAPGSPGLLIVSRGSEVNITILLRFVSHVPEVTETQVKIDPNSGEGLMIEQVYVIEDAEGNIIGRGVVNVNELVSYDISGVVTIEANQTLPVTLTIRVPTDFPSVSFPLGAVGITANVPIIDDVRIMVNV